MLLPGHRKGSQIRELRKPLKGRSPSKPPQFWTEAVSSCDNNYMKMSFRPFSSQNPRSLPMKRSQTYVANICSLYVDYSEHTFECQVLFRKNRTFLRNTCLPFPLRYVIMIYIYRSNGSGKSFSPARKGVSVKTSPAAYFSHGWHAPSLTLRNGGFYGAEKNHCQTAGNSWLY